MATVINNPTTGESSDSGLGIIIGIVMVLVIGGLFIVYGLPAVRDSKTAPQESNINVDVNLPSGDNTSLPADGSTNY